MQTTVKDGHIQATAKNLQLQEFYTQLKDLKDRKVDLSVPYGRMIFEDGQVTIFGEGLPGYEQITAGNIVADPNVYAMRQICARVGMKHAYYQQCQDAIPHLADYNVNEWLKFHAGKKKGALVRMYKTEDQDNEKGDSHILRAFLGDRYAIIDNFDILNGVLEAIQEHNESPPAGGGPKADIIAETMDLTDTRMYMRFAAPQIQASAADALKGYRDPDGDGGAGSGSGGGVCTGFVISNSEVGAGSYWIAPRIIISACNNGMIWHDERMYKRHLGATLQSGVVWSNDTIIKNLELIQLQLRDMIRKYLSPDYLGKQVRYIEEKGIVPISYPQNAVKNVSFELGLSEERTDKVMEYFFRQGTQNKAMDIAQAVTYYAQHDAEPELRYQLEAGATKVLGQMSKYDVDRILKKAKSEAELQESLYATTVEA